MDKKKLLEIKQKKAKNVDFTDVFIRFAIEEEKNIFHNINLLLFTTKWAPTIKFN